MISPQFDRLVQTFLIGTVAFAALNVLFGLAVQIALDVTGAAGPIPGQVGTFLIAVPLALVGARKVGRLSWPSVLLASVAISLATLWAIVFMLNSVAEPAGGHVGWSNLIDPLNWRNTVFGTAAMLVVPQAWLWVLNRLAANNSSKPTPLRGAA